MTPVPPPQPYPQPPAYYPPPVAPGTYPPPPMYAAPPMYPVAPMYMAPPPQPGAKTFEGLKWLKLGVTLALIYNLVAALGSILLAVGLASVGANANPGAILGALAAALAILLVVGILGFIGFILGVMGLYNLSQGKSEFGPAHQGSVEKANKYVLFAILVAIVGGAAAFVVGIVLGVNAIAGLNAAAFQTSLIVTAVIGGAISIFVTYLLALALQGYVERLMTAKGRALRSNFVLFSIIGAGVALALGVVGALAFGSLLAVSGTSSTLSPLAGLISVLTMFWYRNQVTDAEQGCRNMIQSGVLNPDGGAVPAMPVAGLAQPAPYMGQPPMMPPPPPPAGP